MKLVLATRNKGKIREFKEAFYHLNIECLSISEVCDVPEPEETGITFEDNAILKATYYMKACQMPCLADDSGLAVDALGGAPGVYSARYAGQHGDDHSNNEKLIRELQHVPFEERIAHYICVLALAYPDGTVLTAEGTCSGLIQDTPMGDGGFGYDSHFYVPNFQQTMAQLDIHTKETISHRGHALRALIEQIK